MKLLSAILILCVVASCMAKPPSVSSRGCQYILGRCYKECEVGTRAYTTGCGPLVPEPTCDEPNPVAGEGLICDFSACYCEAPTVRDTASGKCVNLDQCPKKEEE
ncbi:uncharacterized protein LOC118277799 isoform X1 [Spodoptera frugiperda]|uniref:Uncharacterized protein LOC118277799 isoform X1 n=1 Tax=Spodoptera frugiperda TaxID=7108 RepID=A0A9R0E017_SPOFR|nr:uncharacterized protein LOC118277799 isoform X1 [Spodoptera frugiperda]